MNISKNLVDSILKTTSYSKGHEGDPQYAIVDYVTLKTPKDFYEIQVVDSNLNEINTLQLKNDEYTETFSEEVGPEKMESTDSIVNFLFKKVTLSQASKWVIETITKNSKDQDSIKSFKKPWFLVIYRNNKMNKKVKLVLTKKEDFSDLKSQSEISDWIEVEIFNDYYEYCHNSNNYTM